MQQTVSIIIPTYNRAAFIAHAVKSCLEQTYAHKDIIVIDDGSTDGTKDALKPFSTGIRYHYQTRGGPSAARNTGLKLARGAFIAFLDSDDLWRPEKLERQLAAMRRHPNYAISHTNELWYRGGAILAQLKKHRKSGGDIFQKSLPLCAVGISTVVMRRGIIDVIGSFDETLPCCEDYDYWLRVSSRYPFLLLNHALTVKNGGRPDQVSKIYARGMDRYRIYAMLKALTGGALTAHQKNLVAREAARKCLIYGTGSLKHGSLKRGHFFMELAGAIESAEGDFAGRANLNGAFTEIKSRYVDHSL